MALAVVSFQMKEIKRNEVFLQTNVGTVNSFYCFCAMVVGLLFGNRFSQGRFSWDSLYWWECSDNMFISSGFENSRKEFWLCSGLWILVKSALVGWFLRSS